MRLQGEFNHQCALFTWARLPSILKEYPALELLSSSGNGARMPKAQAGKQKAAGMKKGVWDVSLPVPRSAHVGMIIEFKYGENTLTRDQKRYGELMSSEGHFPVVVYAWDMAATMIRLYLEGKIVRKY